MMVQVVVRCLLYYEVANLQHDGQDELDNQFEKGIIALRNIINSYGQWRLLNGSILETCERNSTSDSIPSKSDSRMFYNSRA